MQRKLAVLAAGAMLTTVLTGCMEKQGDLGNRNIRNNSIAYDMNGNRVIHSRFANDQMNEMNRVDGHRLNSNNIVGLHKNYRLEMSEAIANRLESMPEVGKAYVMLTDDNAYVAVSLKDNAGTGVRAKGYMPTPTPLSRTQQAYQRPYMSMGMDSKKMRSSSTATPNELRSHRHTSRTSNFTGPNMLQTYNKAPGLMNTNLSRDTRSLTTDMGRDTRNLTTNMGRDMRYMTTDVGRGMRNLTTDVGRGVRNLTTDVGRGVRNLTTDTGRDMRNLTTTDSRNLNNTNMNTKLNTGMSTNMITHSYMGMKTKSNAAVTDTLKDRIANEVKKMSPQIKDVYVSANPDFVNRMTGYMNDVKLGHPIQGFIAEFNAMADRIFPHRAGK
jgi:hypothetical protein